MVLDNLKDDLVSINNNMITFSQFVEVFDSQPSHIDWNNCSTTKGLALFGKEIGKGGASIPIPADLEKGCFYAGKEKYVIFISFSKVGRSRSLLKAISNNEKLANVLDKNMSVAEVNFYRVTKSDLSYGVDKTGNVGVVFSTVLAGVREKIRGQNIDVIVFDSWDTSRTRLYKSFVKKFAIQDGFVILDVVDIFSNQGLNSIFLLVNKNKMSHNPSDKVL